MPQLTPGNQQVLMTSAFHGYNHNEMIQDGEMYDMQNLSDMDYPVLSPRKKRGITSYDIEGAQSVPLCGIHGRDQLVMIRGADVFYNFTEVTGLHGTIDATKLPKKIVSFGAYVLILPDKKYFNTVHLSDCGSIDRLWSDSGSNISLIMCRGDGTDYDMTQITVSSSAPANPTNGKLWMDQSGDVDVLRQYTSSTEEWLEVATTFVKISGNGIGANLKEYDVVEISGLEAPNSASSRVKKQVQDLNNSMIVYFRGEGYIVVAGLLSSSIAAAKSQTVRADLTMPEMDYLCESNNRLWGCKYGWENGQVVNEIRASALGDFRNWKRFMGLSTDSYTASIGTDGVWTGCAVQRGYPVFFKENVIHKVSGSMPSSFSVNTIVARGVQDGSWRSVCVVNEAIYYKSRSDVMMFDGSMPVSVSEQLGNILYSDARAGALKNKYYISMKDTNGHWRLFNYDTEHRTWHKEDSTRALGFGRVDDELFYIDENANTLVAVNGTQGEIENDFAWAAEFDLYGAGQGIRNSKYISMFKIRMYLDPDAEMTLWIKYDDDAMYRRQGTRKGNSMKTFILPVVPRRCDHLRFKITGRGDVRIYSISRILEVGGDGL
jgi:hypothetical protein